MSAPTVFDPSDSTLKHGAAVADPVSPGAAYAQAEAVAVRNAVVSILAALRSANILKR